MSNAMYMFDDINLSLDPPGAYAYAGYVDGAYANFGALKARFPSAKLLAITVFGNEADACDVEPGDMTNADVYNWFIAMEKAGVWRPCVYTSAYNMAAMQATMQANGFSRSRYRMWSAHYTGVPHFCGPSTCGNGLDQADATQFTDRALGRSLDESIIADDFFPSNGLNPVQGLEVSRRGFTSIDLDWKTARGATSYTVKTFYRGRLKQTQNVTHSWARVGRLMPGRHTYAFTVRAHPGGSVGADASIHATTR